MRYVLTKLAKEKQKSNKQNDDEMVRRYFGDLYDEEYADALVADEDSPRKEADSQSDD